MADERIEAVCRHLISNYHKKTDNGNYTSMFAVQSIPMAIKYYDTFQKLETEGVHDLNVATIFTYQANEDAQEDDNHVHSREVLDRIMNDYNQTFKTNYNTDNFEGYFSDVSKRMKEVVRDDKIDILIVVNMFLTGFDSKKLNTLYVDKNLKHHDLIQAYSRTNRVEKERKPYGNIVCYRDLKKQTDEAIEIFSQTDNTDTVLSLSYEEYLENFKDILQDVFQLAPTPLDVDKLEAEDLKKEFVISFRDLSNTLIKLKTFDEFQFTKNELGLAEQTYEDYKGKYLNIYEEVMRGKKVDNEEAVSVLDDIDFQVELMRNDLINVKYIMDLIGQINLSDTKARDEKRHQIHKLLDKADDQQLRLKADLIRSFLDKVVPLLKEDSDINEAYYEFEDKEKTKEIDAFAEQKAFSAMLLNEAVNEYEYSGNIDRKSIGQNISEPFMKRKRKTDQIIQFIEDTVEKYGMIE